jgi:hypothetical protein
MAALLLRLLDAKDEPLDDRVVVDLSSTTSSVRKRVEGRVKQGKLRITGIPVSGAGVYRVRVAPTRYRPSQFMVMISPGPTVERIIRCAVDPSHVVSIVVEASYRSLPDSLRASLDEAEMDTHRATDGSYLTGMKLFDALDSVRKAALLNIFAKAAHVSLGDAGVIADHLGGLITLRRDRCFVKTTSVLREEVANAVGVFDEVSSGLHHSPDSEYLPNKSFKTDDNYGNLQLSFFRKGTSGDDYLVDVDIDEASGLRHVFEVARNHLKDHKTHPYDVREILLQHQKIDPGYSYAFA